MQINIESGNLNFMNNIKLILTILCSALGLSVLAEPIEQRVVLFDSLIKGGKKIKASQFYKNNSSLVYTDKGLLCGKGYAAPAVKVPAQVWDWSEGAIAFTVNPIDFESASMKKDFVLMNSFLKNHNKPQLGFKTGDTCMLIRTSRPDLTKPEKLIFQGQNGRQEERRAYIAIANSEKGFFVKNQPTRIAIIWRKGDEASLCINGVKISSGKPFYFPGPDKLEHVNILKGNVKAGWGVLDGTAYMTDLLMVKGRTSLEELQLLESSMNIMQTKKISTAVSKENFINNTFPVIPFPPLKTAAKLDGKFNEYGFVTNGFIHSNSGLLVDFPCYFYTASDAKNLYLGIQCDWRNKSPYRPVSAAAVNDDASMISSGDLAPLFFRKVTAPGVKNYKGTYITVAPNNSVYDAWEEIDWNRNICARNKDFSSGIKTYSSYKDGVWSLEFVLPRKQNGLDSDEFQFSAGVRLQNQSLHLKNHSMWFDNVDAFLTGKCIKTPLSFTLEKQKNGWMVTSDKNANYTVNLDKVHKVTKIKEVVADEIIGATSTYQSIGTVKKISGNNLKQMIPDPSLGLYALSYWAKDKNGSVVLSRQLPFLQRKAVELTLLNNPIAKKLTVKVEFPGITVKKGEVFTLKTCSKDGKAVLSKSITATQNSPSELNFILKTDNLKPGTYVVKVLRGKIELAEKDYVVKALPQWYTNPVGLEALKADYAPVPWQNGVVVKGNNVSVWGRVFQFGKKGLEKITSQGKTILSAPIVVQYKKNGKLFTIELALKELRQLGKGRIIAKTEGQDKNFRCIIKHTIEFDGLDALELEVHSKMKSCSVEKMELLLPVADAWQFQNWYGHCCQEFGYTKPRTFDRMIALWLGNDDCGLNTFFENHKGLYINSRKPRIRLEAVKGTKDFLYYLALANVPVNVTRPIKWRMGLHPTPIKPLYKNWEEERVAMFAFFKPPFNFVALHTYDHAANSTDFQARNPKLGRDWGEMGRIHNQKFYPYANPTYISKENMVKPDAPSFLPRMPQNYFYGPNERAQSKEWEEFGEDWSFRPISIYPGNGTRHNDRYACSPASSFTDYAVWKMTNYLKDGGFSGFYYDLTTPKENNDESRGYRYDTLDGKSEGTRELFATRDFYKRLYYAFAAVKGEGYPTIFSHGYPIFSGSASFWALAIHGEEFKPRRVYGLSNILLVDRQIGTPLISAPPAKSKRDYSGLLWRIHYSPYRWGIPQAHLSQYCFLPKSIRNAKAGREMIALSFVNNTLYESTFAHNQTGIDFHLNVTMPFKMGNTDFFGYWKNGVKSKPACVKVSYWKKKNARDWLVAVANWSEKEVTAVVELPPELLNAAHVYNMETANRNLKGENVTKRWNIRIPAMDLKVFRFTGGK